MEWLREWGTTEVEIEPFNDLDSIAIVGISWLISYILFVIIPINFRDLSITGIPPILNSLMILLASSTISFTLSVNRGWGGAVVGVLIVVFTLVVPIYGYLLIKQASKLNDEQDFIEDS